MEALRVLDVPKDIPDQEPAGDESIAEDSAAAEKRLAIADVASRQSRKNPRRRRRPSWKSRSRRR